MCKLGIFEKMKYVRKSIKKTYKKRNYRKRSTLNQKVARIAKTFALCERKTKHRVMNLGNLIQLHNVTRRYTNNLLATRSI